MIGGVLRYTMLMVRTTAGMDVYGTKARAVPVRLMCMSGYVNGSLPKADGNQRTEESQ